MSVSSALVATLLRLSSAQRVEIGDGPEVLRVGHWVEVRGTLQGANEFSAEALELRAPEEYEILIGTVEPAAASRAEFTLLGQPVQTVERTEWGGLDPDRIGGARVKLEGHWRGLKRFSARDIAPRKEGRDRIAGRIDAIERQGEAWKLSIMRYSVLVSATVEVEHALPVAELGLAAMPRWREGREESERDTKSVDADDQLGSGYELLDGLRISGQLEGKYGFSGEHDLDEGAEQDREAWELSARTRLAWTASEHWSAVAEGRFRGTWTTDANEGRSDERILVLGETWVLAHDVLAPGLDAQLGRQDFDDPREWIYDQNLDALRLTWRRPGLALELSASTTLADGSPRDEASTNWIAYFSNDDRRRHIAAWALWRDVDLDGGERALNAGGRLLGKWFEDHKLWLELGGSSGEQGGSGRDGLAIDVGDTWTPDVLAPFSFTVGAALASEDHRQTGFHDNTAKFAGVTSFQYYGELLDPELANLRVLTAGVGLEPIDDLSIDFVAHVYGQSVAARRLIDAELDARPDGSRRDLGFELDAILGCRRWKNWDIEVVGAWFEPGTAFSEDDHALLGKLQLRYRF